MCISARCLAGRAGTARWPAWYAPRSTTRALSEGGADALVVENHGDAPFTARRVHAAIVAGMAVAVAEIRRLPLLSDSDRYSLSPIYDIWSREWPTCERP